MSLYQKTAFFQIEQFQNTTALLIKVNQEMDPSQQIRKLLKEGLTNSIGTHTWRCKQKVNIDNSGVHTITRYDTLIKLICIFKFNIAYMTAHCAKLLQ